MSCIIENQDNYPAPIFIVGVPRSGTTLLRVIFDSHTRFACGPEAPWLARGAHSLKHLYFYMAEDKFGYVANFGVSREEMRLHFAKYVNGLFHSYLSKKGKSRWVEKTPDNSLDIPFLSELFPDAKFIHIIRDGRDVACSTSILSEARKAISSWHKNNLLLEDGKVVKNTLLNAAIRWQLWNKRIEEDLKKVKHAKRIYYEDLVINPEKTLTAIMDFLGEQFEPTMLQYATFDHELPDWEWGSYDVKRLVGITNRSIGRWEKQLTSTQIREIEASIGDTLVAYGYGTSSGRAGCRSDKSNIPLNFARLASVPDLKSLKFRWFMFRLNLFARNHGLRKFTNWSKVWEYPWLWFNVFSRINWKGIKVLDLGSELSPMPWYLASLGAEVMLVECDPQWVPVWEKLKESTSYNIKWRIVENEVLPFDDEIFDTVTSFSVIEHQSDKIKAIDEIVRVLKPGGIFALSFDICEPELGMTFPEWNGSALSLVEIEQLLWHNPSFAEGSKVEWNKEDMAEFVKWHLQSAPHHNYAVGAAWVTKKK